MEPIKKLVSRAVVLAVDNVDTDQIIPARFLTTTTKEGLGESLFADWRKEPEFVLNQSRVDGARILVAGENFGCGSSREHAPWALLDFGFRAVVSTSIADIFKNNAIKNGLIPVEIDRSTHERLVRTLGSADDVIDIDLEASTIVLPDGHRASFPIDGFARHCLLEGIDQLDYLRQRADAIDRFESRAST